MSTLSRKPRRTTKLLIGVLAGATGLGSLAPRATAQDMNIEELKLEDLLVVTATLHEQSLLDAPAAMTVVTAADIKARGYRNMAQIFADTVGFNELSDANEEIIGTRGVFTSTTNKTLFLVNGVRQNDVLLGRYNVDQFLGIDSIERVEFIRGPASALYGTGALVGVVNIITKKGRDVDGTKIKYQGGPFANEASLTWGKLIGDYDVFFNFTARDEVGENIHQAAEKDFIGGLPAGTQKQEGDIYWRRYPENFSGMLNVRAEDMNVTLRGQHFRRVTPRGGNGAFYVYDQEPFRPNYTENDFYFDFSRSITFGAEGKNKFTINPALHYFAYNEESFINYGVNRQPPLGSRSGKAAEMNNYSLKLVYDRQFLDNLNFTLGSDSLLSSMYRTNSFDITTAGGGPSRGQVNPAGYSATGRWFLAGVFAQVVYSPLNKLHLTLGGRYDTFQGEADPRFTPRVGIVYKPIDELAVKLLYGQAYLAPQWAHKRAGNADFMGNPNLDPETFNGGDLIVAYQSKKLSATADFYYNVVDGLINSVRRTNAAGMSYFSYENLGQSHYFGTDLTADAQVLPWLRVNAGYSFIMANKDKTFIKEDIRNLARPLRVVCNINGEECQGEGDILDIPQHTVRFGVKVDPIANLSISVWGRYTTATTTLDPILNPRMPATTPIDPADPSKGVSKNWEYTENPDVVVIDATIMYTWNKLQLQLIGQNVADTYYERGGTVPRPLARNGLMIEGLVAYQF